MTLRASVMARLRPWEMKRVMAARRSVSSIQRRSVFFALLRSACRFSILCEVF